MADDVMSYIEQMMQTQLTAVRQELGWETTAMAAAQAALADSQEKISDLKTKEAELVSHLKANGWAEPPA
jgi:hypothetical protein